MNKHRWWIILVWLTVMIVYSVTKIDSTIKAGGMAVSLQPVTTETPVQLSGGVANGGPFVVPVGNNSVWVVDPSTNNVIIVTQNKDGTINATTQTYQTK